MSSFDSLHHFDYDRLDVECACSICVSWRLKRTEFEHRKALTKGHHRTCYCWRCIQKRKAQTEYLAIFNKRDVYCELSWYASKNEKTYGKYLAYWAETVVSSDKISSGWWATRSVYYPLYHFLHQFERAYSSKVPSVSGLFITYLSA